MSTRCNFLVAVLLVLIVTVVTSSCTKHGNDSGSSNHFITYSLSASDYKSFSNINYTDSVGMPGSASAVDSTSYWSKTVATSISPFTAQLEVQGINNTSAAINYTITINVDGVIQATKDDSASPFGSFDTKISAVLQ